MKGCGRGHQCRGNKMQMCESEMRECGKICVKRGFLPSPDRLPVFPFCLRTASVGCSQSENAVHSILLMCWWRQPRPGERLSGGRQTVCVFDRWVNIAGLRLNPLWEAASFILWVHRLRSAPPFLVHYPEITQGGIMHIKRQECVGLAQSFKISRRCQVTLFSLVIICFI